MDITFKEVDAHKDDRATKRRRKEDSHATSLAAELFVGGEDLRAWVFFTHREPDCFTVSPFPRFPVFGLVRWLLFERSGFCCFVLLLLAVWSSLFKNRMHKYVLLSMTVCHNRHDERRKTKRRRLLSLSSSVGEQMRCALGRISWNNKGQLEVSGLFWRASFDPIRASS